MSSLSLLVHNRIENYNRKRIKVRIAENLQLHIRSAIEWVKHLS